MVLRINIGVMLLAANDEWKNRYLEHPLSNV